MRTFAAYVLCALLVPTVGFGAKLLKNLKKVPDWALSVRDVDTSKYGSDDAFVVILDTQFTRIDEKGNQETVTRLAKRFLNEEGLKQASAAAFYYDDTDKVESFDAWVFRANGETLVYQKDDFSDYQARSSGQVVGTQRYKYISATGDVGVGSIFVFEHVITSRGSFASKNWYYQGKEPVMQSSLSLELPEGWRVEPHFFNMDPVDPMRSGRQQTWEVRDLAGVDAQDLSLESAAYAAWASFTVFPPAGSDLAGKVLSFDSWETISRTMGLQHEAMSHGSSEIAAKAQELTAGKASRWEKIKALSEYARSVNYVAVNLDIGTGGGYVPRSASEVLTTKYGDCKDKSNLLCSLLREIGVEAFPVIVNASSRHVIYEDWPSGAQFNHCIVAIRDDSEGAPENVAVEHPVLGKLVIFDPTAELTSLGDLPVATQGSKGILLSKEAGGLIDLPVAQPEESVLKRRILAELMPDGSLLAQLSEESRGNEGTSERSVYRSEEKLSEYQKRLQHWIQDFAPAAKLTQPTVNDNLDTGVFSMSVEFGSPGYGKAMGGVLVTFKPVLVNRRSRMPFDDDVKRTQAMQLNAYHLDEVVEVYYPVGFKATEMPEPLSLQESFGWYEGSVEIVEDKVVLKRRYRIKQDVIPAEEFETVKAFYEKMISFEQASVVMERE